MFKEVVQIPEVCPGGSLAGSPRTWGFALEVSPEDLPSEICPEGSLFNPIRTDVFLGQS